MDAELKPQGLSEMEEIVSTLCRDLSGSRFSMATLIIDDESTQIRRIWNVAARVVALGLWDKLGPRSNSAVLISR
jgi:hypothetical protein